MATQVPRRPGHSTVRVRARVAISFAIAATVVLQASVEAEITGRVVDASSGAPLEGARVHEQAVPPLQVVLTNAQGRFALPVPTGASNVPVAAALTYDTVRPSNYRTVVVKASDGDDVVIALEPIPTLENLDYQPVASSEGCGSCHSAHRDEWMQSNHAGAAVNPLVRDLYSGDGTGDGAGASADGYVFTVLHDAEDSGLCAACHSPNERPADPGAVRFDEIASEPGLEGVTCTSCHQLHRITDDIQAVHLLGNAEFRFPLSFQGNNAATDQHVWGPLDDIGFDRMRAAYAPVFSNSKLCASCHQYENPFTGAPGQDTYAEWLASPAAGAGIQCQGCHMPIADAAGEIATHGAAVERPPEQRHDHGFHGVYSGVFGAPVELAWNVFVSDGALVVDTNVRNLVAGHAWPTGVDVRNAFLVVEAAVEGRTLIQLDGDRLPGWTSDDEPGRQDGDFDGLAGRGYAKVLEGRINGQGEILSPVPFIDADALVYKTTIPAGGTDSSRFRFDIPDGAAVGDNLEVRARVIYRRAWRAIAVTKGWLAQPLDEPFERTVADVAISRALTGSEVDGIFASGFENRTSRPTISGDSAHGRSK